VWVSRVIGRASPVDHGTCTRHENDAARVLGEYVERAVFGRGQVRIPHALVYPARDFDRMLR